MEEIYKKDKEKLSKEVGERLKTVRMQLHLTQAQFAKRLKKSRVTICNYETGRTPYNTLYLKKVAKELNVSYVYLVTGDLPVFRTPQETLMQIIKDDYNLDNDELQILRVYLQMTKNERKSCVNLLNAFSEGFHQYRT